MMPGRTGAPAPPLRKTLGSLRRSVATVPDPASSPDMAPKDSCAVSMTCPSCGAAISKTFNPEPDADDQGGGPAAGAPPSDSGGGMTGGSGY